MIHLIVKKPVPVIQHYFGSLQNQLTKLTLAIICLSLFGCVNAGATTGVTSNTGAPLLLYQKTPCFGTCPAYEALIHTSGEVRFIPWKHVPVTDTTFFKLSAKEMAALKKDINKLNYQSLQNFYKTEWTDMPATHLYFYEGGKEVKHIKHEEGGPEKLTRFNKQLHDLFWKYVATPDR